MAVKQKFWATRPFGYAGQNLSRGQIVELVGAKNDEKLVRLGYFEEWTGKPNEEVVCPEGGERFIDRRTFEAHYEREHLGRRGKLDPYSEDEMEQREERMLAEVAPLKVENATGRKVAA